MRSGRRRRIDTAAHVEATIRERSAIRKRQHGRMNLALNAPRKSRTRGFEHRPAGGQIDRLDEMQTQALNPKLGLAVLRIRTAGEVAVADDTQASGRVGYQRIQARSFERLAVLVVDLYEWAEPPTKRQPLAVQRSPGPDTLIEA